MQQKRELGTSGIAITPLMLGGNVFGFTADEATSFAVLDAYVDLGGNSVDTADVYSAWAPGHEGGESERVLGKWFAQGGGRRESIVLGTKVGMWPKRLGLSRENIIAACDDSLRRLQTDVIDLYQLHRDDEATAPEVFMGALEDLVRAGKVRAVGLSNFKPERMLAARAEGARRGVRVETLQPEYSLMSREIEQDLLPLCVRENVSLITYFALASGYLSGKYRSEADKAKSVRGGRMDKYMAGKGPAVLAALDEVSARRDATPAQVALAWIMAKPGIAAPIASATSVAQVRELMGSLALALSAEELAALDGASA
ncbi:MAG: aldo/keto reductase [Phycisphaerales bacterium]|nr:aldo/keto reductase [Hyphomonadaceae bacterium]